MTREERRRASCERGGEDDWSRDNEPRRERGPEAATGSDGSFAVLARRKRQVTR